MEIYLRKILSGFTCKKVSIGLNNLTGEYDKRKFIFQMKWKTRTRVLRFKLFEKNK